MKDEAARILVVDDERLIRWSLEQQLSRDGYGVRLAETAAEALQAVRAAPPDLVLLDMRLPDADGVDLLERLRALDPACAVIVITAHGEVQSAVRAMKLGAHDYLVKPVDPEALQIAIGKALEARALRRQVTRLQADASRGSALDDLVGVGGAVERLRGLIRQIAGSDATTVLLQGESGTGKDLVARVIHFASARASAPFQPVNCVALPEHLLESELFGHERGAFTDARGQKKGLFEQADGGTVYLDEIGDMRPDLQTKLLRLIEEKSFRRVGGVRDLRVDVRIVAATNRDLAVAIGDGTFRQDLYYRLKVFPITLPALRERPEDIMPLARYFLQRFCRDMRREPLGFARDAEARLMGYAWPGNVRELRNVIERGVILAGTEPLGLQHLPAEIAEPTAGDTPHPPPSTPAVRPGQGMRLGEVERELVQQALHATNGNQVRAARILGISRDALRTRMKKFGFL
jgi:DNA-binding NtrC family response regulator